MLEIFDLKYGSHEDPSKGTCAMEVVAWLAGEPHTDKPACACPVIGSYVIAGNDRMDHETRQRLKAYIPRISGSRDQASEQKRAEHFAWAAITVFAPIALDAAGLNKHAEMLRSVDQSKGLAAAWSAARAAEAAEAAWMAAEAARAAEAAEAAWMAAEAAEAAWMAAEAAKAAKAAWMAAEAAKAAKAAKAATAVVAAVVAAEAARAAEVWDSYFAVLDEALSLGAQGSDDYDFTQRVEAFRAEILKVPA